MQSGSQGEVEELEGGTLGIVPPIIDPTIASSIVIIMYLSVITHCRILLYIYYSIVCIILK